MLLANLAKSACPKLEDWLCRMQIASLVAPPQAGLTACPAANSVDMSKSPSLQRVHLPPSSMSLTTSATKNIVAEIAVLTVLAFSIGPPLKIGII